VKLKKRDCGIKIQLQPCGNQFLGIAFDFYGQKVSFAASSAVSCGQFGNFVSAVYALYFENGDGHNEWHDRNSISDENHVARGVETTVSWDNEGTVMDVIMRRKWSYESTAEDVITINITTDYGKTFREFTVDGRDFCYAVAKACTDALKQYGIYGYRYSTEYDTFYFHQLLFIKAYALDCMEARELTNADEQGWVQKTDFAKEIELLLFDM